MERNEIPTNEQLITIDCDGTIYDSWACCGRRDGFKGSPDCAHVREDTIRKIRNVQAAYPGAKLVILSWRSGMVDITKEWIRRTDLDGDIIRFFIPGSSDDVSGPYMDRARSFASQVRFKVATIMALQAAGNEIIAGYDDNLDVCEALRSLGVPEVQVPRKVEVKPHEWSAGYIGASKPAPRPRPQTRQQTWEQEVLAGMNPELNLGTRPSVTPRADRKKAEGPLAPATWKRREYHAA